MTRTGIFPRVWQRIFRTRADDVLPHVISHQRIYIVPTRRGWAFLSALLIMLVAAVNYSLSLGYALCFLLTGLFASTLLHTYKNIAGLIVQHAVGSDTFAGGELAFHVTVKNPTMQVRHGLQICTAEGAVTGLRIGAERSANGILKVPATVRGYQAMGRVTLQSDWPLGLWTTWSYVHAPVRALVFPRPEENPPPLPSMPSAGSSSVSLSSQQGDVSGLGEYKPGDSIGSIAWKSAARGLGLHVRTFDAETGHRQALLTLNHTGKSTVEEQLSRLCAWVLHAESVQTSYALQLPGEILESNCGAQQRLRALTTLALYGKAY